MGKVIFFYGPDGSGKTTLAKLFSKYLSFNTCVKVSWLRGTHTFASLLARFIARFKVFRGFNNPYYNIRIPNYMKGLWRLIEFISILPIIIFKIYIPSLLGYTVVCERSIPDFIAWIIMTLDDPRYLNTLEAKFLVALSKRASLILYLTADLESLCSRRSDMNINMLSKQLIIYDKLFKALETYKIDTSEKSIDGSLNEIKSLYNVV